ncbi:hypothetical protein FBEOM_7179 [Fusarium beomiforme]|uniref:Uncharacterized protein n=1 Tax=Fusarium beomiforme TaxID=44412 RepID=A0A9P5AHR6_9HYPO|nr:hypothetical protein FBEOM_7179 [Fusarium beomiforme]
MAVSASAAEYEAKHNACILFSFVDSPTLRTTRLFGTSCDGNTLLYTYYTIGVFSTSSSWNCRGECVSVELYAQHDDKSEAQWMISCDEFIGYSSGVSTLYLEHPKDWGTESETPSTQSETTITGTQGIEVVSSPTEAETDSSATAQTRPSEPTETEVSSTALSGDSKGPSAGLIAGAVVGSLAGLALIIAGIILAFRMGKRSRGEAGDPHGGFRDSLGSSSRPTMSWVQSDSNPTVPVVQPVFEQVNPLTGTNDVRH